MQEIRLGTTGCGNEKDPTTKLQYLWKGASVVNENFLGYWDVIWHKWHKFYKVSLLHAEMVRVMILKTLFLSEYAVVYLLLVKILIANIKKNNRIQAQNCLSLKLAKLFCSCTSLNVWLIQNVASLSQTSFYSSKDSYEKKLCLRCRPFTAARQATKVTAPRKRSQPTYKHSTPRGNVSIVSTN